MTKDEIKSLVKFNKEGNSHFIIYLDHENYVYNYRVVSNAESIYKVIDEIETRGEIGIYTIEEIYNYTLNIEKQLEEIKSYHVLPTKKEYNSDNINKALDFAYKKHEGQTRKDGTPYIVHPINVANYVAAFKKSKNIESLIMTAYLHDTLEDTNTTYYELVEKFGPQVAGLVLELTTDEDMKKALGKTKYLEIKMKNMSNWALVIKLCDRFDNTKDLKYCSEDFRKKYTKETLEIIGFILENRNLSITHINIIKHILRNLLFLPLDIDDCEKIAWVTEKVLEQELNNGANLIRNR